MGVVRQQCPIRGNSTLYPLGPKILPASGNFMDIRTRNWAYCAALCQITTEPTSCRYWAWNKDLEGDRDMGPPGTCILQSSIERNTRRMRGIIHGNSRCRPGNDFNAICETYEPVWPAQCQRHADCAGSKHCISIQPNLTRARVRCDVGQGDRCNRRNVCQNVNGVPVGCEIAGCEVRNGHLNGNPSGIIWQDCPPPAGTRAELRRETAKCTHSKDLSFEECADKCRRESGCEHISWFYKPSPGPNPRCTGSGAADRWCTSITPPTRLCFLHDSGEGYAPPVTAELAPGERWYTGNYLCAGTPDAPRTVYPSVQGTRLTPILGPGNKWTNLK